MNVPPHTRHAVASSADFVPQVFGRYLLVQRISSGGMGEIFLAKQGLAGFEKVCVIKKVLPHLSEDEHFLSRFIDEAQVAIQLQHGNVAQVFEVGRVEDEYFLALEFVEGCDLRRALTRLAERYQRFPVELALLIARDVATGLAYAHRRSDATGQPLGVVHCDISPPNLMISFDGEVKIIDFGIAKSALAGTTTDPKMGFGKLGYMAPEQLVRGGRIDARTDIYATGSVLFELLTGRRLFDHQDADHRALARQIIRGQHPLPSGIDPALEPYDALVAQALHIDPAQRFQSAAALRDALQAALVRIHPTLASDHLGMFVRDLFAGEMDEMRQLAARAQGADLGLWQAELAQHSQATVSFALSPSQTRDMLVPPVPSSTHEAGERPPARPSMTALVPKRRMGLWVAMAVLFFIGGAVLATVIVGLLVGRGPLMAVVDPSSEGGAGAEVAAGTPGTGGTAGAGGAAAGTGIEPGINTGQVAGMAADAGPDAAGAHTDDTGDDAGDTGDDAAGDTGDQPASDDGAGSAPEPGNDEDSDRSRREQRRSRQRRSRASADKAVTEDISAAKVQSTFSAVSREYQQFKKSFGPRLEDAWADLAQRAQYAGTDTEKLLDLSQRLARFRARMRAARGE
jgi:serine/threonine protein kinase